MKLIDTGKYKGLTTMRVHIGKPQVRYSRNGSGMLDGFYRVDFTDRATRKPLIAILYVECDAEEEYPAKVLQCAIIAPEYPLDRFDGGYYADSLLAIVRDAAINKTDYA